MGDDDHFIYVKKEKAPPSVICLEGEHTLLLREFPELFCTDFFGIIRIVLFKENIVENVIFLLTITPKRLISLTNSVFRCKI